MKEPLDELLVQACAAQQCADLAAAENGHHSRRLRSAGNNRLRLLA